MKTTVVGAVHSHSLPLSEEGDWLSLLYLVLHTHGPASPPVQKPPAPKQPVLGVLPGRCGRTRTCLYETPAFPLCVGPRTWNFGHIQTLCLWLGFRLSVALTRNSVPVRWHFRRALVPLTRLLLDKAQPTPSHPPSATFTGPPTRIPVLGTASLCQAHGTTVFLTQNLLFSMSPQ